MSKNRSKEHIKAQRDGRRRDGETCQLCGSKESVQGHHVFDHALGGSPHEDNIVALCSRCHSRVHNGEIDIGIS